MLSSHFFNCLASTASCKISFFSCKFLMSSSNCCNWVHLKKNFLRYAIKRILTKNHLITRLQLQYVGNYLPSWPHRRRSRGGYSPPTFQSGGGELEYLLAPPPHFLARQKCVLPLRCPNLASWETESKKFLTPPAWIQSQSYRFRVGARRASNVLVSV